MMAQARLPRGAAAALLISLAVVTSAHAEQQEPYPQIVVSGQGSADIAPDMAVLQLTVTREAKTARAALDASSAAMAEVLKALRAEGIAERDLQTTNFSIQPKYVYPSPKSQDEDKSPRIVGYTVRNGLSVRVRELGKLGGIMDKSVTLGVNEGGNILFTNDDATGATEQARAHAVADAMGKAKALAAAAGVKLGKLLELSEQSHQSGPMPMMKSEMIMARAADSVPVAAGENSYQVTVNMSYGIVQ
tara:strand:+ start:92652 stop:93392 length:741 start_codon:yes stop_codon:yes gene_type:complete